MADDPAYIDVEMLKERLILRAIPLPLDADLLDIIQTSSQMVKDRCFAFDEDDPPAGVRRVTLILSVRQRTGETGNFLDAQGRPIQVPLWTQDLTDILGALYRGLEPDAAALLWFNMDFLEPVDTGT